MMDSSVLVRQFFSTGKRQLSELHYAEVFDTSQLVCGDGVGGDMTCGKPAINGTQPVHIKTWSFQIIFRQPS